METKRPQQPNFVLGSNPYGLLVFATNPPCLYPWLPASEAPAVRRLQLLEAIEMLATPP